MIIERYRRWFDYEKDAHAKTLASLGTVPENRRDAPDFRRALTIMAHIIAARRMWLYRLGVLKTAPALFPENVDLAQLAEQWRDVKDLWEQFLAAQTDRDIDQQFDYQSLDAGPFRNRV